MSQKIQPSNLNASQISNINQNTNKPSGKVAISVNQLHNNAEQYPVISQKKVCFSASSSVKEFSSIEATNKVSKTETITTLTKTDKKTVHNKDIKILKGNIYESLSLISKQIKKIGIPDGRGGKVTLPKDTMKNFNNILSKLSDNIQNYKNELGRSTYLHNINKEKTLSKLEDKLHNTTEKLKKSEGKNNYLSRDISTEPPQNTFEHKKQRQEDYKNA
ncbi:hypothetical protein MASR2M36_10510 [Providencia sp.]